MSLLIFFSVFFSKTMKIFSAWFQIAPAWRNVSVGNCSWHDWVWSPSLTRYLQLRLPKPRWEATALAQPPACSQSPSAAWPPQLSVNPNWNPERNAIRSAWSDTEEGWLHVLCICSSLQKPVASNLIHTAAGSSGDIQINSSRYCHRFISCVNLSNLEFLK